MSLDVPRRVPPVTCSLTPRLLRSPDIGILAGAGIGVVDVAVPPVTGILVTGSELAAPDAEPRPGQIHDGNGPPAPGAARRRRMPAAHARGGGGRA